MTILKIVCFTIVISIFFLLFSFYRQVNSLFNLLLKAAAHRQTNASAMGNPQSSSDLRLRF